MPRQFNTAGPNDEAKHYTLPPLRHHLCHGLGLQ